MVILALTWKDSRLHTEAGQAQQPDLPEDAVA